MSETVRSFTLQGTPAFPVLVARAAQAAGRGRLLRVATPWRAQI